MEYLTADDCVALNRQHSAADSLVDDVQALRTVVFMPQSRTRGADVFPSIAEKAAILGHLILKLRPFTDANAETARSAMHQFLKRNGALSDQSASRQAGSFTNDRHDVSYQAVLTWLQLHLDRPQQVLIDEPES